MCWPERFDIVFSEPVSCAGRGGVADAFGGRRGFTAPRWRSFREWLLVACGQAGGGSAANRASAVMIRSAHGASTDSFKRVCRAWVEILPAIERSAGVAVWVPIAGRDGR